MKTRVHYNHTSYRWVVDFPNGDTAFFWQWENAINYALTKPIINDFDLRDIDLSIKQMIELAYKNQVEVKR